MFLLIVMDKIERHIVTLSCGLLTLVLVFGIAMRNLNAIIETLNVKNIFTIRRPDKIMVQLDLQIYVIVICFPCQNLLCH